MNFPVLTLGLDVVSIWVRIWAIRSELFPNVEEQVSHLKFSGKYKNYFIMSISKSQKTEAGKW